jgi:hypothetical protein
VQAAAGRQVKGVGGKTNGAGDTDWHVSGYCKFKSTRRGHVKIGNKCYTHIHFVARPYLPAVSTKYRSSHVAFLSLPRFCKLPVKSTPRL